jgi:hypothetical protein
MGTITEAVRELKDLNNILSVPDENVRKLEDECDVMGRHVAMQLRELPIQDRIMANVDIQQVLMQYRLQYINGSSETPQSHTSTSLNESDLGQDGNVITQALIYAGLKYGKDDSDDDLY